ncbi:hypothetical protein [Marivita sp. GX14005]|uniref:hypothetical protein n=1 Tax=Marivita sp. GX14005 TaxID=2942276 RepID=UPI002018E3CE|nr:hypothetical protein [Marivita sp. GX14005]MCL3881114.1 hypothetical protein [Marivita sp. GX14005]
MPDEETPRPIADAVDFYSRWPRLRARAHVLIDSQDNREDAELLRWMVRLIDMLGPNDIHPRR